MRQHDCYDQSTVRCSHAVVRRRHPLFFFLKTTPASLLLTHQERRPAADSSRFCVQIASCSWTAVGVALVVVGGKGGDDIQCEGRPDVTLALTAKSVFAAGVR